jgi:hypothetical protein
MEAAASSFDTRAELRRRLIVKAWKDPEFKKNVVKDPKGLLENQLGRQLPAQVKIYVHEENEDTLHFTIPMPPSNVRELSDEDLEKVAGGTDLIVTASVLAFVGIGAGTFAASAAAVTKGTGAW